MNILTRTISWTTAALLLGGFAAGAAAQDFVTEGLVVMYTFDKDMVKGDKLIDAATDDGESQDGIIHGAPTSIEGKIGEAFKFDGAPNTYVEIPAMGEWEFATVEVWALETAFSGIQGIVSTWQWASGKVHFKFQANQIQVDKNGVRQDSLQRRSGNLVPHHLHHRRAGQCAGSLCRRRGEGKRQGRQRRARKHERTAHRQRT